jgi:hypothetical protein
MIWPVIIVVVGLALTLAGLVKNIYFDPPVVAFDAVAHAEFVDRVALMRSQGDKTTPILRLRIEWSKGGLRLLVVGTVFQFIGTAWQVVRLACGR